MRKNFTKKATSMLLATSMIVGSTSFLAGCGSKKNEIVTLDVYSQLANYSGVQTGWIADILKDKFKVKLNIIPDGDGVWKMVTWVISLFGVMTVINTQQR